jgi:hypothetical protein
MGLLNEKTKQKKTRQHKFIKPWLSEDKMALKCSLRFEVRDT